MSFLRTRWVLGCMNMTETAILLAKEFCCLWNPVSQDSNFNIARVSSHLISKSSKWGSQLHPWLHPHLIWWDQPDKQWGFQPLSCGLHGSLCISESPVASWIFLWPGIAVISFPGFVMVKNPLWLIPGHMVLEGFLSPVHYPLKLVGATVRIVKYFHHLWCFLGYTWTLVSNRGR